jgi:hypothetical protein
MLVYVLWIMALHRRRILLLGHVRERERCDDHLIVEARLRRQRRVRLCLVVALDIEPARRAWRPAGRLEIEPARLAILLNAAGFLQQY